MLPSCRIARTNLLLGDVIVLGSDSPPPTAVSIKPISTTPPPTTSLNEETPRAVKGDQPPSSNPENHRALDFSPVDTATSGESMDVEAGPAAADDTALSSEKDCVIDVTDETQTKSMDVDAGATAPSPVDNATGPAEESAASSDVVPADEAVVVAEQAKPTRKSRRAPKRKVKAVPGVFDGNSFNKPVTLAGVTIHVTEVRPVRKRKPSKRKLTSEPLEDDSSPSKSPAKKRRTQEELVRAELFQRDMYILLTFSVGEDSS